MPRLKTQRFTSSRETRAHCPWGWNNPSTQLGPLFPPFLVERKASHCTSFFPESPWHRAGTGMGARGNKLPFLPFIHPSPILPRHLRTTYSTPEGPPAWPDPPARLFIPKLLPCPLHSTDSWPWTSLTIHQSAGSAGSPSSPPSSSSSGTGRLDLAAGSCLQMDDLQAGVSAPVPRTTKLFSLESKQYQGKFYTKNYLWTSCKWLATALMTTRQQLCSSSICNRARNKCF